MYEFLPQGTGYHAMKGSIIMARIGRGTFNFEGNISIEGFAGVAGKKESEGPLGALFDRTYSDNLLGEDSWEKAESRMQTEVIELCLEKCGMTAKEIDAVFAGDLLNQCIASTFGIRSLGIPFVGMYGACSTMSSTLLSAALMIESHCAERCAAMTSSHFSSAERQYRNPIQYGGQRTPTAQWTVTGAGAALIGTNGNIRITSGTFGIVQDLGVKDVNNMGAAMAPAAADTIERHLKANKAQPEDYDLILTGDLGFVGSELLVELLRREKTDISRVHNDGGMMIFDREKQDVHAGGSGCGCSASVLCAYILPQMERGDLRRVLFVGTGALQSPTSSFQGESMPAVAHAVELRVK